MGRYEKLLDIMKKASGRVSSNGLLSEGELATTKALTKAGEEKGFYNLSQHTPEMTDDVIKNGSDKFENPAYLNELQAADNRQGLGTMLLKRAEDEAYKNGSDSMYLVPDASINREYGQSGMSQEALENFYKKQGYTPEPLARRGFDNTQAMSKSFDTPPLDMSVEARAKRAYEQGYLPDESGKFINTHTGNERSANAAFDPKDIDKNKLFLGAGAVPMADQSNSRFSKILKDNAKAASMGIADAATLGFGDELGGTIAAGLDKGQALLNKLGLADKSPSQIDAELGVESNIYKDVRDNLRKEQKQLSEENPIAYYGGNIAGGMMIPGSSIKSAATLGGAYGLGSSQANDVVGMAKDTALGAGLGAGLAKGMNKLAASKGAIANAIDKGADKLRGIADDASGIGRLPEFLDDAVLKVKDVVRPAAKEFRESNTERFKGLLKEKPKIYNPTAKDDKELMEAIKFNRAEAKKAKAQQDKYAAEMEEYKKKALEEAAAQGRDIATESTLNLSPEETAELLKKK